MTNEEYLQTQQNILFLSGVIAKMPLAEFINKAEMADTLGPFADPTLWMKGKDNLAAILDLARALRNFQDIIITKRKLGVDI